MYVKERVYEERVRRSEAEDKEWFEFVLKMIVHTDTYTKPLHG